MTLNKKYKSVVAQAVVDDGQRPLLPGYESVRTILNNERLSRLPRLPKNLDDVKIEGEWAETCDGETFLMPNSTNDLLIFSTNSNLQRLSECNTIYVDGTFKTCPKLYAQVYTIHGLYHGWIIPLVYALLTDKTSATYYKFFNRVREAMAGLRLVFNPSKIMSDFESGLIETVKLVFPSVNHLGCHFHFAQSIWRKVQDLGLVVDYKENAVIRAFIQRCIALAFIPLAEVEDMFMDMEISLTATDNDRLRRFISYFRSTWLNGIFAVSMWNKYGNDHYHRTNNAMESWHAELKKCLTVHPNIFVFIHGLKICQASTKVAISKAEAGASPPKRKLKYVKLEEKIQKAFDKHVSGEIDSGRLLRIVQYSVNLTK